jgi:hypothetical protein
MNNTEHQQPSQDEFFNPINQVFFRAGLLACREYMARFIEPQNPLYAASIRSNWWPQLGEDPGPPRQLDFDELTEGEYGTAEFRCKDSISPTLEALPVAWAFLVLEERPTEQKKEAA